MLRTAGILPANRLAALSDEKPLKAHAVGGVKALTIPRSVGWKPTLPNAGFQAAKPDPPHRSLYHLYSVGWKPTLPNSGFQAAKPDRPHQSL